MLLLRVGFYIVLLFGISMNAYATPAGSAYAGLLTKGDWKHLQEFYDLYYTRDLGLIKEFQNELALFRRYNNAIDNALKQHQADGVRCEVDCATLAGMNRQMAEINRLLAKARGQVIANSRLLQKIVQSSTKANVAYTEAQAAYELRKLGFDIPKIVADTFNFDFGPLLAQLAKNLGAEGAAGPAKPVGSVASRTFELNQLGRFYPKKEGLARMNFKRALGSAVVEELAKQLIPAEDANAEFVKSLTIKFTSELWQKLNELAAESKEMTKGALTQIAIKAVLGAYADAVGRQLQEDVERAKKDTKRSESSRLLAIAEWKAMMHLRRLLNGNRRERGIAQELNWETGHLLHLSGKLCTGVSKEMPRTPPAEKIEAQSMQDVKETLKKVVSMLQQVNMSMLKLIKVLGEKQCNQSNEKVSISGTVRSEAGNPLSGAVVSVEIAGKRYTGTSGADGSYRIDIPEDVKTPDQLIISADKEGFNTATRIVNRKDFKKADIRLSKVSKDVIQIDKSLHHLGNSNYGGTINSRFQKPQAEAVSYTKEFEIPEGRFGHSVAFGVKLRMTIKGAEEDNPVLINGKKVGVLAQSNPDGSATDVNIPVDPCVLKPGKNVLTIKADDSNKNNDVDDFEFANIQLVFSPPEEFSPGDKRLAELSSVRVLDPEFKQRIKEVSLEGRFSIEAKGKGKCETLREIAFVDVFPKSKGEDSAIRVRLVETGPDTGIFRSESPVSVKDFKARAGEKILARAGLRGTSVVIKEKEESWKVYKLKVEKKGGGLTYIRVIEISFWRKGDTAELSQWAYPVNYIKNTTTGRIPWRIQWDAGTPLTAVQKTLEKSATEELARRADKLKKGSMQKAGLEHAINRALGPGSAPLYKDWQTRGLEKKGIKEKKSAPKVSRVKKGVEKKVKKKKKGNAKGITSTRSKVTGKKDESPGTISVMGGSKKLKAGIPVKGGPPSREERCSLLRKIKQRIDNGERPRLFERYYESPNGETFKMIEASEDPELKPSGYRETVVRGFIVFSEARKSLEKLIEELGCR